MRPKTLLYAANVCAGVLIAITLVSGCGGVPENGSLQVRTATPTVTVSYRFGSRAARQSFARSTPAEQGKPYPFRLFTHCGVDWKVDFDGSFWELDDRVSDPGPLGNPDQEGTMTLLDPQHARFDFRPLHIRPDAEQVSILFVRGAKTKHVPECD